MSDVDTTGRPPPRPRWVKISLMIVLGLLLLFAVLKLTGAGGQHGPGRHIERTSSQAGAGESASLAPIRLDAA